MIRYLIDLVARKLTPAPMRPTPVPPTSEELEIGLKFLKNSWVLEELGDQITIPPVKCPVRFGGCGYVEGRTKGIRINSRIILTEADDDMEFTEYCVLIDGVPSMLIMLRGHGIGVMVISGQDYFEQLLSENSGWARCTTLKDYNALPIPVQKVMGDILKHCANKQRRCRWISGSRRFLSTGVISVESLNSHVLFGVHSANFP